MNESGFLFLSVGLLIGIMVGIAVHYLLTRGKRTATEVSLIEEKYQAEITSLKDRIKTLSDIETNMSQTFKALSQDALKVSNELLTSQSKQILEQFHEGAKADLELRHEKIGQLVRPVQDKLGEVDKKLHAIEVERQKDFAALGEQIKAINEVSSKLTVTTGNLSSMLSNTKARGRWGEVQLHRVAELAGMSEHCDFTEQSEAEVNDGKRRPDMVVNLPSKRVIIVDSKVPMDSFIAAHEATDEEIRKQHYASHAAALKSHIRQLSSKSYFDGFSGSPEFVVMFLPNEAIYSTALEYDNSLSEYGAENDVILATPTTLIALLKAAAYGWRQEVLAKEVEEVGKIGKELYDRVATMAEYVVSLGSALDNSVKHFNKMVASLETRVFVSARRFKELKVIGDSSVDIDNVRSIETVAREIQSGDLKQIQE